VPFKGQINYRLIGLVGLTGGDNTRESPDRERERGREGERESERVNEVSGCTTKRCIENEDGEKRPSS